MQAVQPWFLMQLVLCVMLVAIMLGFWSERQAPLTCRSVHTVVARAGQVAGLPFPVHPHMLRHAKGYQLAAKGVDTRAIQAYLGHRNIQYTVTYTQLYPSHFMGFGKD